MELTKSFTDDHQVIVTVVPEAELLESSKRKVARNLSKRTKISGYRPGKAPYGVVLRHFGEAQILDDAINEMINNLYPEILDQEEIKPYGPGTVDNIELDPLSFDLRIPLEAEITLQDYSDIRIDYSPREVEDDEIEQVLTDLQMRHAVIEPSELPAEIGDVVNINFTASIKGSEEELFMDEKDMPILLRNEDENEYEWPYPGFSINLVNRIAGDEFELEHKFLDTDKSDRLGREDLVGMSAIFSVEVISTRTRNIPELDDEFAKTVGSEFDSFEDLRQRIETDLSEKILQEYNLKYDDQIFDAFNERSEIKYPPQMVEREIEAIKHDLDHELSRQGLTFETFLAYQQKDEDSWKNEAEEQAVSRVKRGLVMAEFSKQEDFDIDSDELDSQVNGTLNLYQQVMKPVDYKKLSKGDNIANIRARVHADMITRKVMDAIRDLAKGEFTQISQQEEDTHNNDQDELIDETVTSPDPEELQEDAYNSELPLEETEANEESDHIEVNLGDKNE